MPIKLLPPLPIVPHLPSQYHLPVVIPKVPIAAWSLPDAFKAPSDKVAVWELPLKGFKVQKLFVGLSITTSVEANPLDVKSLPLPLVSSPKELLSAKVNLKPFVP